MGKALIVATLLLGGCASSGSFCKLATPHDFGDAVVDAMTRDEVNRELAHNELGAKICGWKPAS